MAISNFEKSVNSNLSEKSVNTDNIFQEVEKEKGNNGEHIEENSTDLYPGNTAISYQANNGAENNCSEDEINTYDLMYDPSLRRSSRTSRPP